MTKNLLSKKEDNDISEDNLIDVKLFLHNVQFRSSSKFMKEIRNVAKKTSIFLYDDNFLISKYPDGLVTENIILIPKMEFNRLYNKDVDIYNKSSSVCIKTTNTVGCVVYGICAIIG